MKNFQIHRWIRWKLANIQEYYALHGFQNSIVHVFERLAEYVGFSFYTKSLIFFELDLQHTVLPQSDAQNLDFFKVEPCHLDDVEGYHDGWFDRETALQRINDGHLLFVIRESQEMAFFQWIELHATKIPSIDLSTITLPEKTACMAYMFTKPAYRGRRYASKAKPLVLHYLREHGYQYLFLVIAPENTISQRVNKKAGFQEYQTVAYRKVFFRKRFLVRYYRVIETGTFQQKMVWSFRQDDAPDIWNMFSKR